MTPIEMKDDGGTSSCTIEYRKAIYAIAYEIFYLRKEKLKVHLDNEEFDELQKRISDYHRCVSDVILLQQKLHTSIFGNMPILKTKSRFT